MLKLNEFDGLKERISELKKELNALIVAHNYQRAEESVVETMAQRRNVVAVPEEIRKRAKQALDSMLTAI